MRTRETTIIRHWKVSWRAWLVFWIARIFVKPLFAAWPTTDRGIAALGHLEKVVDRLPKPKGVTIEPMTLRGVPSELISHHRKAADSLAGATVLYFHGGGFVFCGLATHRSLCAVLAARAGVPVISVEYRQLPYGGIGTSIHDAMAAYTDLLGRAEDPTKIILAGDSAGGYLAMKVAELAATRGMVTPAAVIGYSPLLNLALEKHDPDYMRRDAYLPMSQVEALKDRWAGGPEPIAGADSPIEADPRVYPPVFFSVAQYELMRPDVEAMTGMLEDVGQAVETHVWSGQIHAYPVMGTVLTEATMTIAFSLDFARRALGYRGRHSA
ncbi:alpha/beta hydrolase fold domain-containing protein [Rhodococcus hoagii]|nr:alpha/beta hydrolase fold domain-containing protein [Prescottella equi]MBM4547363.1 alpha/beta hydrolase fold domain-containing protein [Prescottella equi]MBM4574183.1 alpha/beta hydrolase fold domain-containing protein [Prescottella equi]MBM4602733.1 alpha/beta hydrolase fold domain-containing protein [Prescottella equi]